MGQEEILDFLKKQEKPLSRGQIAIGLDYDEIKVSHLIRKLLNQNEIKSIEISRYEAKKILGDNSPCRRCRIYFI